MARSLAASSASSSGQSRRSCQRSIPQNTGALLGDVMPGSSAEGASLKGGDVVVEFNGKKVTDSRQIRFLLGQTAPDTSVTIKVLRNGKEHRFTAKLAAETTTENLAKRKRPGGLRRGSHAHALDGITVEDIAPRARRQFDIPPQIRAGGMIVQIAPGCPADEAGVKPGDVIYRDQSPASE